MNQKTNSIRANILVIDDDEAFLKLLHADLVSYGFKITAVPDGEVALFQLGDPMPDLILLDLTMPGMNGFDVLRHLKRDKATKSIPVMMLTSCRQEKEILEALQLGAVDYLTKPFSPDRLVARITKILGKIKNLT